jgi:hypothetical protein
MSSCFLNLSQIGWIGNDGNMGASWEGIAGVVLGALANPFLTAWLQKYLPSWLLPESPIDRLCAEVKTITSKQEEAILTLTKIERDTAEVKTSVKTILSRAGSATADSSLFNAEEGRELQEPKAAFQGRASDRHL